MLKRLSGLDLRRVSFIVLLLVLTAHILWMLSLPAWPSQDGPVHLYYTHLLGALFSGESSTYQPYFFIKHLLPPYAVYYYMLLLLSHGVSLLTADRLVICGYFVSFVLGFRYAARALGPNAEVTSLLASLLMLNWPLGMGFANYCLSLSFALWAIGIWLRLGSGVQFGRRMAFLALLVLITLSHPVPLLVVLAFGGLDLVCRFLSARGRGETVALHDFLPGIATLASGTLCLLYVKAFTVAHPLQQRTAVRFTPFEQLIRRGKDILITKNVEVLYGKWWQIEVYRVCVGLILLVGASFALMQWRRNRTARVWLPADSMFVFASCLLFALLLLPSDLSGAYYFNERLHLLLWITFLLAASGWAPKVRSNKERGDHRHQTRIGFIIDDRRADHAVALASAFAVFATALLLNTANHTLRPFADRDYQLAHTDLPLQGQLAVVLDHGQPRKYVYAGPPWDPYFWDTVALLRHNDGIMENPPWLDSPIIPLAPTAALPGMELSPTLANSPAVLAEALQKTPALRSTMVDKADVVLFTAVLNIADPAIARILGGGWTCKVQQGPGYRLCLRNQALQVKQTALGMH
ncbi:MAG: hypothetical protein ACRYFU_16365 [Janthinobacterium lividum]